MPVWNDLFERGEFRWSNPDENLIALAPLLKARAARCVLDLACGAGRHLVYLTQPGFEMYGVDIVETGLNYARQGLAREGLVVQLAQSEMCELPFAGESFDAVICIHAIQHQTLQGLEKTTGEIHRVVCMGGLLLATFPSRRDWRYGRGQEIEANTFIAEQGPDVGVPHHYFSLGEIEELLQGYMIRKVELEDRGDDRRERSSHWQVLAERE